MFPIILDSMLGTMNSTGGLARRPQRSINMSLVLETWPKASGQRPELPSRTSAMREYRIDRIRAELIKHDLGVIYLYDPVDERLDS
ncbi:MAG: hypothetical protein CMB79_12665 [Filomicrobium sp.]|nr:hypothetical protein [Filomicrobium sp.]